MSAKKMLLFDIDGTLLLTGGTGKVALEAAILELFGFPDSWGELHPDGKTDPAIIDEICERLLGRPLSAQEYQTICDRYHHHFEREIESAFNFRLMPGIRELLGALAGRQDLIIGLATGNFEPAALMKLKKGSLHSFFRFGGYASDARCRKELTRIAYERGLKAAGETIPPQNVFVIGDTIHDITAGQNIGAHTIAVCTGSTKAAALREKDPAHIFEDLTDLPRFLSLLN
ncbi:MAG TPA: HAD-IA family hydrolase [Verrucomicrobiae bacterium]|jgi:HAD superfamily hydrolase (TIGR01549 family)|nr:HAD-IA family hydrolase [Verrucomicrobiae bacterium]